MGKAPVNNPVQIDNLRFYKRVLPDAEITKLYDERNQTAFSCTQFVNIPDANFKATLVANTAINTDGDNEICVTEAQTYTGSIDVSNRNIADLTGIEAFVNLTKLSAFGNNITSIDLSSNTKLTQILLENNRLEALDVSMLSQLKDLKVHSNLLTALNVANGNNANFTRMEASANSNQTCIQIDTNFTPALGWNKDATVSYSANCSSSTIAVTGITVSGSNITTNGDTSQMSDTITPTNATNSSVTWSVDNTNIATISTSGLLTAVANGTER